MTGEEFEEFTTSLLREVYRQIFRNLKPNETIDRFEVFEGIDETTIRCYITKKEPKGYITKKETKDV